MSNPRPKILTAFDVPTGGWDLRLTLDPIGTPTNVDITIPAGTYFMSWDGQSDDFLATLEGLIYAGYIASGEVLYATTNSFALKPTFAITDGGKVVIDNNGAIAATATKFDWTVLDGASVAAVLGFDSSAALTVTASGAVGDYPHAYGWYSDTDGQLASDLPVDVDMAKVLFAKGPAGQTKAQYVASTYRNELELQFLSAQQTYSNGVDYATASVAPYERNQGLECWWREARQGKRFRVYRNGKNYTWATDAVMNTPDAADSLASTAGTTSTLTAGAKAFDTEPQEHKGRLLLVRNVGSTGDKKLVRSYISSHTGTVMTLPTLRWGALTYPASGTHSVLDQRYSTYVLDLDRMQEFAPTELPNLGEYNITIPLLRYVA